MKMLRRTYSLTEEELKEAKKRAEERGKSLSRLVRDYLISLPEKKA